MIDPTGWIIAGIGGLSLLLGGFGWVDRKRSRDVAKLWSEIAALQRKVAGMSAAAATHEDIERLFERLRKDRHEALAPIQKQLSLLSERMDRSINGRKM